MTIPIRPLAMAALAMSLALPTVAQSDGLSAYEVMQARKEIRNHVTDTVIDFYSSAEVVEDTSAGDASVQGLRSGEPIPESVDLQAPPEGLADMLPRVGDAEWARIASHLVAVDDGMARVVVWEVLP
jgi:hypothetical protein